MPWRRWWQPFWPDCLYGVSKIQVFPRYKFFDRTQLAHTNRTEHDWTYCAQQLFLRSLECLIHHLRDQWSYVQTLQGRIESIPSHLITWSVSWKLFVEWLFSQQRCRMFAKFPDCLKVAFIDCAAWLRCPIPWSFVKRTNPNQSAFACVTIAKKHQETLSHIKVPFGDVFQCFPGFQPLKQVCQL